MVRPKSTGRSHNKNASTYSSKRVFKESGSAGKQRSLLQLWGKESQKSCRNLEATDVATPGPSKTSDDTLEESSSSSSFPTSSESDVEDTFEMEEQTTGNPVDKNMSKVSCHNIRTTLRAFCEILSRNWFLQF